MSSTKQIINQSVKVKDIIIFWCEEERAFCQCVATYPRRENCCLASSSVSHFLSIYVSSEVFQSQPCTSLNHSRNYFQSNNERTSGRRVLETLIVIELVKKYLIFYETESFIMTLSIHKSPRIVPILSQMKPFHICPFYFWKMYFNIILPSVPKIFQLVSFLHISYNSLVDVFGIPHVPHALPIVLICNWNFSLCNFSILLLTPLCLSFLPVGYLTTLSAARFSDPGWWDERWMMNWEGFWKMWSWLIKTLPRNLSGGLKKIANILNQDSGSLVEIRTRHRPNARQSLATPQINRQNYGFISVMNAGFNVTCTHALVFFVFEAYTRGSQWIGHNWL